MLLCTASRTSSPWHNFVSDTERWVDGTTYGTGSTPCLNNGGIYQFVLCCRCFINLPRLFQIVLLLIVRACSLDLSLFQFSPKELELFIQIRARKCILSVKLNGNCKIPSNTN